MLLRQDCFCLPSLFLACSYQPFPELLVLLDRSPGTRNLNLPLASSPNQSDQDIRFVTSHLEQQLSLLACQLIFVHPVSPACRLLLVRVPPPSSGKTPSRTASPPISGAPGAQTSSVGRQGLATLPLLVECQLSPADTRSTRTVRVQRSVSNPTWRRNQNQRRRTAKCDNRRTRGVGPVHGACGMDTEERVE